jgi:hypothetical protein
VYERQNHRKAIDKAECFIFIKVKKEKKNHHANGFGKGLRKY